VARGPAPHSGVLDLEGRSNQHYTVPASASAGPGVFVHGEFLGPIDTDMNSGFDIPKATTESAARGIFYGLERNEVEIFPDPVSQSIADGWRAGVAKALEKQFSDFCPECRNGRKVMLGKFRKLLWTTDVGPFQKIKKK